MITNMTLLKYDIRRFLIDSIRAMMYGRKKTLIKSRVPPRKIKQLIYKRGFALTANRQPSWFYSAYDRGDGDPLTNYVMEVIIKETPKDAQLLVTGCGTGITLFFLLDQGFQNVEGFDYLEDCVYVANEVAKMGKYKTKIWQDNGFYPSIQKKYDLITALHWVYSAWGGNYGNDHVSLEEARLPETREKLLTEFLSKYPPLLNSNGKLIVELVDQVADYRLPYDGNETPISDIYPVRLTREQMMKCAEKCGFQVLVHKMSFTYSYHPRSVYILKKP